MLIPLACDSAEISCGHAEGNSLMVVPRKGEERSGLILAEFAGKGGSYTLPCPMFEHLSQTILSGKIFLAPYEAKILEIR